MEDGKTAQLVDDLGGITQDGLDKPDCKLNAFSKKISVGSYSTMLYFGGKQRNSSYSSVGGGIVTLIGFFVFSILAIIIIIQTYQRKDYTFSQSFIPLLGGQEVDIHGVSRIDDGR